MQTKTISLNILAVSLMIQQLRVCPTAAVQPASGYPPVLQTNPVSWSVSEREWLAVIACYKTEGQCLQELISKLKQLEEEIILATACHLGSLAIKPPDGTKLVDSVSQWQEEVESIQYLLDEFKQKIVSSESKIEKLATVVSHALELVAMVGFLDDNVLEMFLEITHFGNRIDSTARLYYTALITNLESSLEEVVLGTPIVRETNAQTLAKNFEFNVLGELVHELKIVPVDVARLQQASSTVVHQQIMELVGVLNGQAVVFRKIINLLKSTIQQSSTLAVVGSLQRITNLLNREEQQIASLTDLIGIARHSLSTTRSLLMLISETRGNSLSVLASRVTQLDSYRNALQQFQRMTPQVIDYTLNLLVQLESIQRIARRHSIPDIEQPFSRLDEIADAVRNVQRVLLGMTMLEKPLSSLQRDATSLTGFNAQLVQTVYTVAQDIKLQNEAHLTQHGTYLKMILDTLSPLVRNIQSEVKNKNSELHQKVDELSASVMLVTEGIEAISRRVRSIEEFSSCLLSRIRETPQTASDTERVLESLPFQFSAIEQQNVMVTKAVNSTNVSVNDAFAQLRLTMTALKLAEEIVNSLWNLLDQVSLPVEFSNDTLLTFSPGEHASSSSHTTARWEFQSVSFSLRKAKLDDCIVIHLSETWPLVDHYISLVIGVVNRSMVANFVFSNPIGGIETISLVIEERIIAPNERFLVEVSRTDRNVHLLLHDLENGRMYCSSGAVSSMMSSFFQGGSVTSTKISVGGTTSNNRNSLFLEANNFTGCLSEILLNGENLNLWSLAATIQADMQSLQPCSSSEIMLKKLRLSCNGSGYTWATILQGNFFPLEFTFSSFHRNGILMFASSGDDMARFIQVSLINGHIVVKISSNGTQTTLTSRRTYTNGANQLFSLSLLSLDQGLYTLTLQTPLEETQEVKMQSITETEAALNLTDVFLCGVPNDLVNTTGEISNFTGCAAFSSGVTLDPLPLNCSYDNQTGPCLYCLNEGVYSASFYGASYASFVPVTVKRYFDFRFSFITAFPNGLLLHSGNASRGLWFDVVILNGRLELLFGSPFGALSLPARTQPLNDLSRHTVVIVVNIGSNIDILVDGNNAGSFPFGSIFPVGTLSPALSVGGIDPRTQDLILPAVTMEGFKGCMDHLHVLGQPVDFSGSVEADQVNFKLGNDSQSVDAFLFDGEGYARYDLGRFDPDFNLGLQLRTVNSTALLLYVRDALALQLVNGEVRLVFFASNETVGNVVITSNNMNISDDLWHSVIVRKNGSFIQLLVDNQITSETTNAPEEIIGTTSDLFVGGAPSDGTISLLQVTEKRFKGELRMAYLEHSILSRGIQRTTKATS